MNLGFGVQNNSKPNGGVFELRKQIKRKTLVQNLSKDLFFIL
jgi:hypothetical protein